MNDILKHIIDSTPGAKAAILMGFDGIAVEQMLAEGHEETDIESMAMEFSFRFIELKEAAQSLELGDLEDVTIKAKYGTFLCRALTDEFFVAVLLADAAGFGRGRWALRSQAKALQTELS